MPDTEPPQSRLEDPIPIFLRLMRHSTTEVRNRVLDQLGIEQGLRAYAMEHLWVNNMVTTEGELTKLGRFAADMEPNDPENAALLWYGHQFNVLEGSNHHIHTGDSWWFSHKSKGKELVPTS